MKIMVDLDPRDVWRIQEQAERQGITPGQALRDELTRTRNGRDLREAIRSRVTAGMCDADIATDLGWPTVATIAQTRRSLGLKANPRYRRTS